MDLSLIKDKSLRIFIGIWWQEQQHFNSNGLKQVSVRTEKELTKATGFIQMKEINNILSESGFLIKPYTVKNGRGFWISIPNNYILSV